jgi:hypothetical protein
MNQLKSEDLHVPQAFNETRGIESCRERVNIPQSNQSKMKAGMQNFR